MSNASDQWKVPRSKAHYINQQLREEILQSIEPALFGDYWDFPHLLEQFEYKFAQFIGLEHVAAVHSGTAALFLALKVYGLQPGDEVITVANSDMGTTSPIVNCGGVPVFCDVLESDYTINPELVESLITERTRGILPVDLYGHPADVKRLRACAKKHGLFIVEDAAIATASRDYGLPVGAFADQVCFSTCPTKQLGAVGNGGIVATADKDLREKLQMYRDYGLRVEKSRTLHAGLDQLVDGLNIKMSPVDAAVLSLKIDHLPQWTTRRKQIVQQYTTRLQHCEGITLPSYRTESEPVCREFVLRVRDRDSVFYALREKGVQAALNYFPPAYHRKAYEKLHQPESTKLEVSETLSREILALPVDPLLTEEDIDYVCDSLIGLL